MTYELYDTKWRLLKVTSARSFKEAITTFEPFHKGMFWVEHARSGEARKVRL
jgi:hypothetical protein